MNPAQLLKHQWEVYPQFHRTRENLLLHIALVPLFLAGNAGLIVALWRGAIVLATLSLVCMLISIALQGRGHRIEAQPPRALYRPDQRNLAHLFRAMDHVSPIRDFRPLGARPAHVLND